MFFYLNFIVATLLALVVLQRKQRQSASKKRFVKLEETGLRILSPRLGGEQEECIE